MVVSIDNSKVSVISMQADNVVAVILNLRFGNVVEILDEKIKDVLKVGIVDVD